MNEEDIKVFHYADDEAALHNCYAPPKTRWRRVGGMLRETYSDDVHIIEAPRDTHLDALVKKVASQPKLWASIQPSGNSTASDVVVIQSTSGELHSTTFSVRFPDAEEGDVVSTSSSQILKSSPAFVPQVDIYVNDEKCESDAWCSMIVTSDDGLCAFTGPDSPTTRFNRERDATRARTRKYTHNTCTCTHARAC